MAACEKCWADAARVAMFSGGDQTEIYHRLIGDRDKSGRQCSPAEQCGEMHALVGAYCRCGKRQAEHVARSSEGCE